MSNTNYFLLSLLFVLFSLGTVSAQKWDTLLVFNAGTETNNLYDVTVIDQNDVWAIGLQKNVGGPYNNLILHYDGIAWQQIAGPADGGQLSAIAAVGANDVWAVGATGATNQSQQVYQWNGRNWINRTSEIPYPIGAPPAFNPFNVLDIEVISANDIWFAGWKASTAPGPNMSNYLLHYDGSSFSEIAIPSPGQERNELRAIDAVGPNDIWAISSLRTLGPFQASIFHYDGTSWQEAANTALPAGSNYQLRDIGVLDANNIWVSGDYNLNLPSGTALTSLVLYWNGTTWVNQPSPDKDDRQTVRGLSSTNVWTGGFWEFTHDDGFGWAVYASPGLKGRIVQMEYWGNSLIAVGGTQDAAAIILGLNPNGTPEPPVPCDAPTNTIVTNITANSATISWTPVPNALGYEVQYKPSNELIWISASTAQASIDLTNLLPSRLYNYRIKTTCGNSTSAYVDFTPFVTQGVAACNAPLGSSFSNLTSGSVTLNWGVASSASSYDIQYKAITDINWTTISNITANTYQLTGLTPSTFYSWQVASNCGGGAQSNFVFAGSFTTLSGPSPCPTITVSIAGTDANGGNNGTAIATASGGLAPYGYAWSNGSTGASISGLAPASYTVTASDVNGCVGTNTIIIQDVTPPPPPPGGCTYVEVNKEGFELGWGIWNDGGSDAARSTSNSNTGTFCIELRDNTSASTMTTNSLDFSSYNELKVAFSYLVVSFDNSAEDFWLQISTNGGASFTTVEEWNRGDEFQNNERKFDEVIIPGPFSANTLLRFRCDASGDSDWVYIDDILIAACEDIPVGNDLTLTITSQNNVNCFGASGGSATAAASGGTGTYSYNWSNGATTAVANGLSAASYTVTVSDGISNATASVTISQPNQLTVELSGTDVSGTNNGAAIATANGGTAPYSYVWSNGGTGESISGLSAGIYTVSVTDANGCNTSNSINILDLSPPPPGGCTYVEISQDDFESGWGIWSDGGSDAARVLSNAASGVYSIRLRDNTASSTTSTSDLDLSNADELRVDFSYFVESFDNATEDFWLQISTDGGLSYTTIEEWNLGDEFQNNERKSDSVIVPGPFTSNTRVRFRCDASTNTDLVYLDDIVIAACNTATNRVATNPNALNRSVANEKVANSGQSNFSIYPNPVQSELMLEWAFSNGAEPLFIRIFDVNGRVVQQSTFNLETETVKLPIDVANFKAGLYFISVKTTKETITKRFIKG